MPPPLLDVSRGGARGRTTRIRVPRPSGPAPASTLPPCRSTIDWTIQRPSPMPLCSGSSPAPARARSARTGRRCRPRPPAGPALRPPPRGRRRPRRPRRRSGRSSPAGANLLALASRFTNTWVRRGASPTTRRQRDRGDRPRGAGRAGRAAGAVISTASSTTSSRATGRRRMRALAGLDAHALQQVVDELRQAQAAALQGEDEALGSARRARPETGAGGRAAARSRRAGRRAGS